MKPRDPYGVPDEKRAGLRRAIVLEWVSIGMLACSAALMYLVMGASQAMKTAWIEDVLSLAPPIAFLVAVHIRRREPNEKHPYGYRRAMALSFLVASAAVAVVGLYVLHGSVMAMVKVERPTIGHDEHFVRLFGWRVWAGWPMMAVLALSVIGPVIIGRMKLPLAEELHEKTLHADAAMNKADWMTGGAAMLGVLGIGLGFWWADAVAALVISLDIVKDGLTNTKRAVTNLMDQRPTSVRDDEPLDVGDRVRAYLRSQPRVLDAAARLREEGETFTGELLVVFDGPVEAEDAERLARGATDVDWRLHELAVVPVRTLAPSDDGLS